MIEKNIHYAAKRRKAQSGVLLCGAYSLEGKVWLPEKMQITHVIHVVHGMTEHIGRYKPFAEFFTTHGVAVAGFDLRGHGHSSGRPDCASFISGGNPDNNDYGWAESLNDLEQEIFAGRKEIQDTAPNAKYILLGFSLGSFLVREYLGKKPLAGIDGVILAGTGYQPPFITNVMQKIIQKEIYKAEPGGTTPAVRQMAFGPYNKKFEPNRTEMDWLCSDPDQLDEYLNDPWVRQDIAADLFYEMLGSMSRTNRRHYYRNVADLAQMPVLILSGAQDPVGNMGKDVGILTKQFQKSGLRNVNGALIPNARHDIFHEFSSGAAENAQQKTLDWLKSKIV